MAPKPRNISGPKAEIWSFHYIRDLFMLLRHHPDRQTDRCRHGDREVERTEKKYPIDRSMDGWN